MRRMYTSSHIYRKGTEGGFSFVEVIISLGIFLALSLTAYQVMSVLISGSQVNREQVSVAALADQYLEIARNLPYSQVGTTSGNPHGNLVDFPNATTVTYNNNTYKIYYEVTYIDDPADGTITGGTDFASNDYKQVKLKIQNNRTNVTSTFITTVVPKGLENLSSGGALSLQVIDANGDPVPGATLTITNTLISPAINLTRTADTQGKWIEVGLPVSINGYHVVATYPGYSTDSTSPITVSNPNPTKPDATIANGQVTALSFAIDLPADLTFLSMDQSCNPLTGITMGVRGAKLIGTPNVYKFDNTYVSNGSGQVALSGIEWDTYTPAIGGSTYMMYGSSPIQEIQLFPTTSQLFTVMLGPKSTYSLLVIVKDAATNNPIEGAQVDLISGTTVTKFTGGNQFAQQNWSGGSGQASFTNSTKYFSDDSHISTTTNPIGVRLIQSGKTVLATSGWLISSTFDTGSSANANYSTLTWQPTSQTLGTTAKFQIATNNDNLTWNFIGPDGTASTYYTTPATNIASVHTGKRYIRYKLYLETTNNKKNPTITSVGVNYVSGCYTPGQVMFPNLSNTTYSLTVSAPGFQTQTLTGIAVNSNNTFEVLLSP